MEQQKRIVAEIEKQFSRLDEAVANLKRVKANLKRYKAAVLKAAVEGKLTEGWRKQHPDVEPASKLLERILAERRQKWEEAELAKMKAKGKVPKDDKWKKKYKAPVEPDSSGLTKLPRGWVNARLDTISNIIDSLHKTPSYVAEGYPMVRVTEIKGGILDFSNALRVTEDVYFEFTRRYKPGLGDIVLSRVGTYGNASLVNNDLPFCLGQNTAVITPLIEPRYLHKCLESIVVKHQIDLAVVGSTQKTISLKNISALSIPVPPIAEQKEIISQVESKHSIIELLERSVVLSETRVVSLRHSILQRVFSGELLQSEPGDEPARNLLERIKKQSDAKVLEPKKKRGRRVAKKKTVKLERRKVFEVLREVDNELSTAKLIELTGYPSDADPETIEPFYLDLKNALETKEVEFQRKGDFDYFRFKRTT